MFHVIAKRGKEISCIRNSCAQKHEGMNVHDVFREWQVNTTQKKMTKYLHSLKLVTGLNNLTEFWEYKLIVLSKYQMEEDG